MHRNWSVLASRHAHEIPHIRTRAASDNPSTQKYQTSLPTFIQIELELG
jgi:hypothetical protein